MTGSPSRARRLSEGWSANLLQMALGVTQQVALVPVFLHFWTGDVLAAWLAIYAVGNLVLIADAGLQFRAINRFLALQIERRLRWPHRRGSMPRCCGSISGLRRRSPSLLLVGAQFAVAVRDAWISGGRAFRSRPSSSWRPACC